MSATAVRQCSGPSASPPRIPSEFHTGVHPQTFTSYDRPRRLMTPGCGGLDGLEVRLAGHTGPMTTR